MYERMAEHFLACLGKPHLLFLFNWYLGVNSLRAQFLECGITPLLVTTAFFFPPSSVDFLLESVFYSNNWF